MRAHDRARADRRSRDRARPRGSAAARRGRFQLDRYPAALRAGAGGARRIWTRAGDAGTAGTDPPGAMKAPRAVPVTRRRLIGALAACATLGAPAILRAAPALTPTIR